MRKLYKEESGQGLALALFFLGILLIIGTFLIDGGRTYYLRSHAYNIAEATAISAATDFDKGEAQVIATANEYALLQGLDIKFVDVNVVLKPKVKDSVTVIITIPKDLFFGKLFGLEDTPVTGEFTYTTSYR